MLLGFYKQFVEPIQIGTKVFTLRKRRKVRPKIGETLHMYTGGYNATRTLISNKEKLLGIQNVRLTIKKVGTILYDIKIFVDRRELSKMEVQQFAIYDGFENVIEWADHWLGKKTRTGALIEMYHWTDLKY